MRSLVPLKGRRQHWEKPLTARRIMLSPSMRARTHFNACGRALRDCAPVMLQSSVKREAPPQRGSIPVLISPCAYGPEAEWAPSTMVMHPICPARIESQLFCWSPVAGGACSSMGRRSRSDDDQNRENQGFLDCASGKPGFSGHGKAPCRFAAVARRLAEKGGYSTPARHAVSRAFAFRERRRRV